MEVRANPLAQTAERDRDNPMTFYVPYATMMLLYMLIMLSSGLLLHSVSAEKKNQDGGNFPGNQQEHEQSQGNDPANQSKHWIFLHQRPLISLFRSAHIGKDHLSGRHVQQQQPLGNGPEHIFGQL